MELHCGMELDTDSAVSMINKPQFDEYFSGMKTIYTSVILKTYSREEISALCIVDIDVEYNEQQQRLPLFVDKNGGPALFGRQWHSMIKLDWKSIKHLAATQRTGRLHQKYEEIKLELKKYFKVDLEPLRAVRQN